MWPFTKKQEIRADTEQMADIDTSTKEGQLLRAALTGENQITIEQAIQIPTVAACARLISDTVSMVPFRLYKVDQDKVKLEEVTDDQRVSLINLDPKDTLNAVQFKKRLVWDYLLDKGGYAYIDKVGNTIRSLRYVEPGCVSFNWNADPIFKDYDILVNGNSFQPHQFIKILRNTKDGYKGIGIVEEQASPLLVAYRILNFQDTLMQTGGLKKGFIKSPKHLTDVAIKALKDAWVRLFGSKSENVVILNDGLEFQESSETSTEMQINENTNTYSKQICEIFGVPVQLLNREVGTANEEDRIFFIQYCIQPILTAIEDELDRVLLLESEKGKLKWAADTSEFTKADVLKRYQAYEIASKNGFMQIDEIRFKENMEPLGIDFVKLGLQDVLYYPNKGGMTFVPNMNAVGGINLAMDDREEAKKQKEVELKMQAEGNIDDIAKKIQEKLAAAGKADVTENVRNEQENAQNDQENAQNEQDSVHDGQDPDQQDETEEGGEEDADRDQE